MTTLTPFGKFILDLMRSGVDAKLYDPGEKCIQGDLRKDGADYKVWDGTGWVWISGPCARKED